MANDADAATPLNANTHIKFPCILLYKKKGLKNGSKWAQYLE